MAWIHAVIDVPGDQLGTTERFWGGVLGWETGAAWAGNPELRSFEPPSGDAYVHLQEIDGPPRIHLDLESDDREAVVSRAIELGASPVDGPVDGDDTAPAWSRSASTRRL